MNRKKILIIDDDPIILFLHEAILEDIAPNAEFLSFENGKLAKEYILGHDEYEFLLFLDINMPVMNGWELLQFFLVYERPINILVIMVTSSVNESDRIKAFQFPMVKDVLIKPLSLNSLKKLCEVEGVRDFFY